MARLLDPEVVRKLSVAERMVLIDVIWSTLEGEAELTLSAEDRREIERRIENWRRNPASALTHEEFKARIRALSGQ